MLETIRAFAAERLATSGEADEIRRRHAERMVEIARSANLTEDDDDPIDFDTALAERDDFRAALDWASANDPELGLELALRSSSSGCMRRQRAFSASRICSDVTAKIPARLRANALRSLRELCTSACCIRDRGYRLRGEPASVHRIGRRARDGSRSGSDSHREPTNGAISSSLAAWSKTARQSPVIASERSRRKRRSTVGGSRERAVISTMRRRTSNAAVSSPRPSTGDGGRRWGSRCWPTSRDVLVSSDSRTGMGAMRSALFLAQESRDWCVNALGAVGQVALARGEFGRAGLLWGAMSAEGERSPSWQFRRDGWAGALVDEERPEFAGSCCAWT